MKRKHVILGLLLLLGAGLLAFASMNPPDQVVEAVPRTSARSAAQVAHSGTSTNAHVTITALRARSELIAPADTAHHTLFGSLSPTPPLPSAAPAGADVPPLPPEPAVPSVPFTYLGKQSADGHWEVYLGRGDETLIVHEQMVIDGTYRVDAITPPTMALVYLPLKQVQTLDVGSAD